MYRFVTVSLGLVALAVLGAPIASASPAQWSTTPIPGPVVRDFEVGPAPWSPGHRGVDLAGNPGDPVVAPANGVVTSSGTIVGRGSISIDHGGRRTTYEPVTPVVTKGTKVVAGQVIGHLNADHAKCSAPACLHWGLIENNQYLDPLETGRPVSVRLLPTDVDRNYLPEPALKPGLTARIQSGPMVWPAQGLPGSPFGMRLHPILGYRRMHWGTDIGAACGSPLYAAADGTVTRRSFDGGHGNHLILDVGSIQGTPTQVGYSHAAGYTVAVGAQVKAGQVIGSVGSTGLSTGCHLHLELWRNGVKVDPMSVFSK